MARPTICYYCLSLFPVYGPINEYHLDLVPANQRCSFCPGLEEHRSPFRWEECITEEEARRRAEVA